MQMLIFLPVNLTPILAEVNKANSRNVKFDSLQTFKTVDTPQHSLLSRPKRIKTRAWRKQLSSVIKFKTLVPKKNQLVLRLSIHKSTSTTTRAVFNRQFHLNNLTETLSRYQASHNEEYLFTRMTCQL